MDNDLALKFFALTEKWNEIDLTIFQDMLEERGFHRDILHDENWQLRCCMQLWVKKFQQWEKHTPETLNKRLAGTKNYLFLKGFILYLDSFHAIPRSQRKNSILQSRMIVSSYLCDNDITIFFIPVKVNGENIG